MVILPTAAGNITGNILVIYYHKYYQLVVFVFNHFELFVTHFKFENPIYVYIFIKQIYIYIYIHSVQLIVHSLLFFLAQA